MRIAIRGDVLMAIVVSIGIVGMVILAAMAMHYEQKSWEIYAREAGCKAIERQHSYTVINDDGSTSTVPAQTVYKCNDGMTHIRAD